MFDEVINGILDAERRAEEIGNAALLSARDADIKARAALDDLNETALRAVKSEVKRILSEASAEADRRAAALHEGAQDGIKALKAVGEQNADAAAGLITDAFIKAI
jgi:vacuolar-type H+-ATPase subunit H